MVFKTNRFGLEKHKLDANPNLEVRIIRHPGKMAVTPAIKGTPLASSTYKGVSVDFIYFFSLFSIYSLL